MAPPVFIKKRVNSMNVLIYIVVLSLCYGIYNILCYYFIFPTISSGYSVAKDGNKKYSIFFDNMLVSSLSEKLIEKWKWKWQCSEAMEDILRYYGIQTAGTAFLIRRLLFLLGSWIIAAPMLFVELKWFLLLWLGSVLVVFFEGVSIYFAYQKSVPQKKNQSRKKRRKAVTKIIECMPGIYILMLIALFGGLVYEGFFR